MSYELRVPGDPPRRFENEADAMHAVAEVLKIDPNSEVEVIDLATNRPAAPGANKHWRAELKNQVR